MQKKSNQKTKQGERCVMWRKTVSFVFAFADCVCVCMCVCVFSFFLFLSQGTIEETFWDSAGIADLLTTCYGGRNRRCAEAFIKTGKSWPTLEKEMLGGQKSEQQQQRKTQRRTCNIASCEHTPSFSETHHVWLTFVSFPSFRLQGTSTCRDVYAFLQSQGKRDEFPLLCTTYDIADCGKDPHQIVKIFMSSVPRAINKSRTPLSRL